MKTFLFVSCSLLCVLCVVGSLHAQGSCSNFAGGVCPANIPSGVTHFYFIDCGSGSDSNSGASESAAWAHAPGMNGTVLNVGPGTIDIFNGNGGQSCGSSPCNYSGYGFIFRGGVTCGAGTGAGGGLPWVMREYGTSGTPLYFGVDSGWYTGGSWARPIMNAGGSSAALCGSTTSQATASTCFSGNALFTMAPTGYVYVDNFEWTNLYWYATGVSNGQETYLNFARCNSSGHCVLEHNYMHGWAHHSYSSGANADVCNLFGGDTSVVDRTSIAEYNVVDGSDTAEDACVAFWGGPPFAFGNFVQWVPNGAVVDSAISYHDNTFTNIITSYDTSQHQNTFEDNGTTGGNEFFYNNFVSNTTNSNGLTLNFAPCTSTTTYVFNNLEGNTDDTPLNVQPECGSGTLTVFNNTIELGADSTAGTGNSGVGTGTYPGCPTGLTCNYQNNHFIGTNNQSTQTCNGTCNNTTNLSQTISVAKANSSPAFNQYAFSQSPYIFAPTASTNSTVGAGTSNSTLCSTINGLNTAAGAACLDDTTYGISYNSSTHVTGTVPNRTANVRNTSTPNQGGYEFSGSAPSGPDELINGNIKITGGILIQ